MLLLVLSLLLLATFVLMIVRRRDIGRLTSFATLLAAVMLMIWMQNNGLLPGSQGRFSDDRPRTSLDPPAPAPAAASTSPFSVSRMTRPAWRPAGTAPPPPLQWAPSQ